LSGAGVSWTGAGRDARKRRATDRETFEREPNRIREKEGYGKGQVRRSSDGGLENRVVMSIVARNGRNGREYRLSGLRRRLPPLVQIVGDRSMNNGMPDLPCRLNRARQEQKRN
jgi:hypothetical protein